MDIVGAHPCQQLRLIAMHIDQCLKAVFLSGAEQPVDRPFLVGFQMVGVEIAEEIAADHLPGGAFPAQCIGDEAKVLLQRILAVDRADKIDEPADDIILEILIVADGNDVVAVGNKGGIFAGIPIAAGIGKPVHIQRIPPEHTAHSIGDKGDDLITHGADIARALHRLRHSVLTVIDPMHGHILVRHLRCQLVLQTVDVDENAIQLFFVLFELQKPLLTLRLPCGVFVGNQL